MELHCAEIVIGSGTLKMAGNGGDWRSKSLALPLMVSTTLDGFYFANCVLADALFRIIN